METFLLAFVIFGLAVGAMALGLLLSGKKLTRTCASGGPESECACARARAEARAAGDPEPRHGACQEAHARPCACETRDADHDRR